MIPTFTEVSPSTVLVGFKGDNLDASNVKEFREKMQPAIEKYTHLVIDMGSLHFVDSSGLGALLSTLRAVNNKQGELRLFAMTRPVIALFELVRMNRIFSIYANRDEALSDLKLV